MRNLWCFDAGVAWPPIACGAPGGSEKFPSAPSILTFKDDDSDGEEWEGISYNTLDAVDKMSFNNFSLTMQVIDRDTDRGQSKHML